MNRNIIISLLAALLLASCGYQKSRKLLPLHARERARTTCPLMHSS